MHEGMELEGIIRSVRSFGVFVDVGSTTDGLCHISDLLPHHRQFIGNQNCIIASEGEQILVEVVHVDREKRKFALREVKLEPSIRTNTRRREGGGASAAEEEEKYRNILTGDENLSAVEEEARRKEKEEQALSKWSKRMKNKGGFQQMRAGSVTSVTEFGAFVDVGGPVNGLLHVKQMRGAAVNKYGKILLKPQDKVEVRLLEVDEAKRQVRLTMEAWKASEEVRGGRGWRGSGDREQEENKIAMEVADKVAEQGEVSCRGREAEGGAGGGGRNAFSLAWERAIRDAK